MVDRQAVEAMIMERVREDACGLHEIVRALHERYPSMAEAAQLAAARAALRSLLDAGKVRLYCERWAPSIPFEAVPAEEIPGVLDNPVAWESGSRYVCFAAREGPGRTV